MLSQLQPTRTPGYTGVRFTFASPEAARAWLSPVALADAMAPRPEADGQAVTVAPGR